MKKIFCLLLGATIMCSSTAYAKIDETTIVGGTTFEYADKVTPDAGISITVLKPLKTMENFENASDKLSVLAGYREAEADSEGNFEVEFNFGGESGVYNVFLGIEGQTQLQHKKLHYVNEGRNTIAVLALKDALDEVQGTVEGVIASSGNDLGMDTALMALADSTTFEDAAALLVGEVNDIDFSNKQTVSAYLDKALAIALLNNGDIEPFGEYRESLILNESVRTWCNRSFVDNDTYAYMDAKLSRTSQNFAEFDKAIVEAVALGIIRDADGYGSITSYLKEFSGVLGIQERYVTDAFAQSIIGKEFDSIEDTNMENFTPNSTITNNPGVVDKGGTLGGVGVTGVTSEPAVPLPKNEEEFVQITTFGDLQGYTWAEESINELYNLGIINGRSVGVFAPGETVLREEFVKMILEAGRFGKIVGSIDFIDVPQDAWFYEYVRNAFACEIISGVSNSQFGSGYEISRQDMAVVCYNMLNKKGVITADSIAEAKKISFNDAEQIADYAVSAIEYLSGVGILNGDDKNMFHPKASLTRAEAAAVVYRTYQLIEKADL